MKWDLEYSKYDSISHYNILMRYFYMKKKINLTTLQRDMIRELQSIQAYLENIFGNKNQKGKYPLE